MYFRPIYGKLNEIQLLRVQPNQEGDIDIYRLLSRYTSFLQKYDVLVQNCQPKVNLPWISPPVYGTLNGNRGQNKTKREIPMHRLLSRGIVLSGQKYDAAFNFDLIDNDERLC